MSSIIKKLRNSYKVKSFKRFLFNLLPSNIRIQVLGYKDYVGGNFSTHGKMQLNFLKKIGLKKKSILFDVACGSLRLGKEAIKYLDSGNYIAIEENSKLVELGKKYEVKKEIWNKKKPRIIINKSFNFDKFDKFDFAICYSLITHLTLKDTLNLFKKLKSKMKRNSKIIVTYYEVTNKKNLFELPSHDFNISHPNRVFRYKFDFLKKILSKLGYTIKKKIFKNPDKQDCFIVSIKN